MLLMNNEKLRDDLVELFIDVCEELSEKIPEKEAHFHVLQCEAKNYTNFPIVTNLSDTILENYDALDRETIIRYIRAIRVL